MLRITKQADYGIVLLTVFARAPERAGFTARDLAAETRLPLPMVSKTLKMLASHGLLVSHRGVRGGYSLSRPAVEVSVAEIIAALEGPIALTECSDDQRSACDQEGICPTQANWQKINRVVHQALDRLTLADMTRPLAPPAGGTAQAGALGGLEALPAAGRSAAAAEGRRSEGNLDPGPPA